MAEPPAWPSYRIGPHDSVFALGVVSVNYASLEFALSGVFANVIGLTDDFSRALLPKIGNEDRITLLRQALCGRDWPADLKDHITHFIDGFKILAENRNQLMHSNMAAVTEERIALYKSNRRDGKTILTQINLADLRQVADEMMAYYDYGSMISNVITLLSYPGGWHPPDPLLAKLPLPRKLEYSSLPNPASQKTAAQTEKFSPGPPMTLGSAAAAKLVLMVPTNEISPEVPKKKLYETGPLSRLKVKFPPEQSENT
jgi:hypothetical protein